MEFVDILEQNIIDKSPELLSILLSDKTTGKNIIWATDNYIERGAGYAAYEEIFPQLITKFNTHVIQPRVSKTLEEQKFRTKDKAEVFTPSWICNAQNNLIDERWFDRKNVFNIETEKSWITNLEKIEFTGKKTWKKYVDAKRLEISCGEAPYLVSRYDTITGEPIPIKDRIGLLDRKLRVVCENTDNESDWMKWAIRAVESIYGYDYQGDNVLLARENILYTFVDYMIFKFAKEPSLSDLKKIANKIAWNIWQMDGLTLCVPFIRNKEIPKKNTTEQLSWFNNKTPEQSIITEVIPCRITDWRDKSSFDFKSMINGD